MIYLKKSSPLRLLMFSTLLLSSTNMLSQKISFEYDANGNRISRKIVVEELQQTAVNFENLDLTSLNISKESKTKESKGTVGSEQNSLEKDLNEEKENEAENLTTEGKVKINIYPNPVKEILKIDITNMPFNPKSRMVLFDMGGTKLAEKLDFENHIELDISQYKDGMYIIIIQIDNNVSNFKVIKNK